jgi:transcriptional regulator with XRE-family HTH domain
MQIEQTSPLREARTRQGMTQQQLAWASQVNVLTISRAELGKQQLKPENARRIAAILEVPTEVLLANAKNTADA